MTIGGGGAACEAVELLLLILGVEAESEVEEANSEVELLVDGERLGARVVGSWDGHSRQGRIVVAMNHPRGELKVVELPGAPPEPFVGFVVDEEAVYSALGYDRLE